MTPPSALSQEQVQHECEWLVEEHCGSAARKWIATDAALRQALAQQAQEVARLKLELSKWQQPFDADMLDDMKRQTSHGDSLAAQQAYIAALEHGIKQHQQQLAASQQRVGALKK